MHVFPPIIQFLPKWTHFFLNNPIAAELKKKGTEMAAITVHVTGEDFS
jgi:hypothetical protein